MEASAIEVKARLSHPVIPAGRPALVFLRVDVESASEHLERPPLDLAIVLDRSGSMAGEKIRFAHEAIFQVIDRLLPTDQLALVAYDDTVEVVFPRSPVVDPLVMRARASTIGPRGSTNLSAGLIEGLQQLRDGAGVHRALLISDGLANVGVTSPDSLASIAAQAPAHGRSVSAFGVGVDFNEEVLRAVADGGSGYYSFIESPDRIPDVLLEELGELGAVVAQNLLVEFQSSGCEVTGVLGFQGAKLPAQAGDVLAGGRRSVLLALSVPPQSPGEVVLGEVTCRFTPLGSPALPEERKVSVAAIASEDLALVEARVDREVMLAAQLQLVADEHRAAADAARRGDDEQFQRFMQSTSERLMELGDSDSELAKEQRSIHEELSTLGADGVAASRSAWLQTDHSQYKMRQGERTWRQRARGSEPANPEHLRPWGERQVPLPPEPPRDDALPERVAGMLLGLAIGDSLGNTSEGMLAGERGALHGEIRDYLPNRYAEMRAVGLPSDDTQLAFWTLESLLDRGRLEPENLARRFSGRQIFGIGSTVRGFLRAYKDRGASWEAAGQPSAGNGALMRIAPVALPHVLRPSPGLWADVIAATALTHRDDAAVAASVGFVGLLFECLGWRDESPPPAAWWLDTFLRYARPVETGELYEQRVPGSSFRGSLCDLLEQSLPAALAQDLSVVDACDSWFSGAYLLETVPSVLYVLARHGAEPGEALVRAVNDTRDNDTVAAIVGAAVGALHGRERIPLRWREGLLGRTAEGDDGRVQALVEEALTRFVPKR